MNSAYRKGSVGSHTLRLVHHHTGQEAEPGAVAAAETSFAKVGRS